MKLYRFPHSGYARKIQVLLELLGAPHTVVEVPYADRRELVAVTGGYLHVPVLVDDGKVIVESRRIAAHLLAGPGGAAFVPAPWEGPVWAYHDWVDGPLEDVLFRLASPAARDHWRAPEERALYTLIKERKFGPGCIEAWQRSRDDLIARGRELLAPTARTLAARPFLFGDRPTLADAALYGMFAMLTADATLPPATFGESFPGWIGRLEAERRLRG
jgi:glutathione S-transferase